MSTQLDTRGTTPAVAAPQSTSESPAYRWRWAALFVILAGEVMDLLDALVTTIAGPTIRTDLGGSESMIQWLGAGYTLAMAVGLVTGGRLGDLYGRKRMFMIGAAGFATASMLCAFAQSPGMLIGSRVLQGLLGAVMLPQGLGMIKEMFPPKEVPAAFGAFGPVMALSAVGGPILAGWLVTADYFGWGWRMIFLINLPLGIAALAGAAKFLPRSRGDHATKLDLRGVAILTIAALLIVYPLVEGRDLGWPAWTLVAMVASLPVFALFGLHVRRVARRGGDPLVTPSLFGKRAFTGGLGAGTAFFASMIGFTLVFSLYLQIGLGYSALHTGLANIPVSAGMVVGFIVASAGLTTKLGRRLLHVGLAVMAAGTVAFAVQAHLGGSAGVPLWHLVPALLVTGLGTGLTMAPFFDIILAGVEPHETGSAAGTLSALQQLGGALGIAVMGTVFFHILKIGPTGPDRATVASGMQWILWMVVGLLAVTFATAFLLPRKAREESTGH
ncbi:MAG TPA: MFS transporter [Micromonosporaceae bacterium]|nr:MFS transporter [Micromonosporaceae bacterium]